MDINERANFREDYYNISNTRVVDGGNRVEPIVHRGPINLFSAYEEETHDLSVVNQQPVFATQTSMRPHILPKSGLSYLEGVPSVHINQTFELNESFTGVNSENRFAIRGPYNEALFVASERSTSSDRTLFGAFRPFSLQFLDKTHQESLILERKHECGIICCCCRKERLFLIIPPGDVVGVIEEEFALFDTVLVLRNSSAEALYRITIPKKRKLYMPKEKSFIITSADGLTQKGTINRNWNSDLNVYTLNVYFVDPDLNIRLKSLFLGAAFLLEYMYFQGCGCC